MIQRIKTSIKPLLALGLTAFLLPGAINAQSDTNNRSERIVIIRPADSKDTLTVKIENDKITVNGKEVDKGDTPKGVSVSRTRVNNRTVTGGGTTAP